jgi:hypothetical protein
MGHGFSALAARQSGNGCFVLFLFDFDVVFVRTTVRQMGGRQSVHFNA